MSDVTDMTDETKEYERKKPRITITISPETFQKIEETRGMVPRSKYINHVLQEGIRQFEKQEKKKEKRQ